MGRTGYDKERLLYGEIIDYISRKYGVENKRLHWIAMKGMRKRNGEPYTEETADKKGRSLMVRTKNKPTGSGRVAPEMIENLLSYLRKFEPAATIETITGEGETPISAEDVQQMQAENVELRKELARVKKELAEQKAEKLAIIAMRDKVNGE